MDPHTSGNNERHDSDDDDNFDSPGFNELYTNFKNRFLHKNTQYKDSTTQINPNPNSFQEQNFNNPSSSLTSQNINKTLAITLIQNANKPLAITYVPPLVKHK